MMFVVPKKKKKSLINRFPFMVIKKEGTPRYACFWAKLTTSKLENWESVLLRLLKSKYNDGHSFCTSLCYMQLVLIVCMHKKSLPFFRFRLRRWNKKGAVQNWDHNRTKPWWILNPPWFRFLEVSALLVGIASRSGHHRSLSDLCLRFKLSSLLLLQRNSQKFKVLHPFILACLNYG